MYASLGIRLIVGSSHWPSRPKPWVARLHAVDERWGFQREFIRGVYDYTHSSKGTGKNTYLYFAMPPGLYEGCWSISWKHEYRGFWHVDDDGEVHDMTREEVIECLTNAVSESAS